MPARITSDADDRINLRGTVREIAPILDETTREAIVEIDLGIEVVGIEQIDAVTTGVTRGATLYAVADVREVVVVSVIVVLVLMRQAAVIAVAANWSERLVLAVETVTAVTVGPTVDSFETENLNGSEQGNYDPLDIDQRFLKRGGKYYPTESYSSSSSSSSSSVNK